MKTQWVLNDDEKTKFLNARRRNKKIQVDKANVFLFTIICIFCKVGESKLFASEKVKTPRALWIPTEADNILLSKMVCISGFFDNSKVGDMNNQLVREVVR